MSARTYSDGDLLTAIHLAISARDFEAVSALLHVLAVQNPRAAQDVLDIVELAKVLNR
jgi:hypothetical protein